MMMQRICAVAYVSGSQAVGRGRVGVGSTWGREQQPQQFAKGLNF